MKEGAPLWQREVTVTRSCEQGQLLARQPLCSGFSAASSESLVQDLAAARCRAQTYDPSGKSCLLSASECASPGVLFCEHGQLLAWQPLCSGSSAASSEQLVQYLAAARGRPKTTTHQASLASSRL